MQPERSCENEEETTVQRILKAATEIFAEAGFSGARIDTIAKRANVNKAAIYYHIGGKQDLYTAVLQHYFSPAVEQIIQEILEASTPEAKLRRYIRQIGYVLARNDVIAPIMLRELASGGEHLSEFILQTLSRLVGALTSILREGERQGVFRPAAPFVIHFMIIGAFLFSRTKSALITKHTDVYEPLKTIGADFSGNLAEEVERLVLNALKQEEESP